MQLDDGHPELLRHRAGRRIGARLHHQDLRAQIAEIELVLLRPEQRAQGSGDGTRGDGDEGSRGLGSVGQDHRNAIATPHSERVQVGDGSRDELAQLPVTQRFCTVRGADGASIVCTLLQKIRDRLRAHSRELATALRQRKGKFPPTPVGLTDRSAKRDGPMV